MADIKTNQSKVYNALKGMGFSGIGANEEEFAAKMGNPKNREKVYNALSSKGYKGIGKDLAAFDTLIYQAQQPVEKPTPTQPTQQLNYEATVSQQKPVQPVQIPHGFGQFDQNTANQMGAGRGPVSWQQPQQEPKEETVVEKQQRMMNGKATPKEEKQVQNRMQQRMDEAAYEQETGKRLRQPVLNPEWEAPTVSRDEFGNIRHDENGNVITGFTTDQDKVNAHQQVVEEQNKKTVEDQLKDAYAELEQLEVEIDKGKYNQANRLLSGMLPGNQVKKESNAIDMEQSNLLSAKRLLERRITALEAERDNPGFWRGTGDQLKDPTSWSFGLTDAEDALVMANLKKKLDAAGGDPSKLTTGERLLAENYLKNQEAQQLNQNRSWWYGGGQGFGKTLSFMKDFAVSGGGFANIAEAGMRFGAKQGARLATKTLGDYMTKNLGTKVLGKAMEYAGKGAGLMAGAEAGGFLLNNTAQAASSAADIINQQTGNLTYDKDGKLTFEGGKSLGEAFLNSQISRTGENGSELMGRGFDAMPNILGRVIQKTTAGKVIKKLTDSKFWKKGENALDYLGVQSVWGEGLEEEYNMARTEVLNQLTGGEFAPEGSGLFDWEQQLDTWKTVGLTSMILRVPSMIVSGTQTANYYANQYNLNTSDRNMRDVFGDAARYEGVKTMMDDADNSQLPGVLNNIMNNEGLSKEEKEAAFMYANDLVKLRGFNIGNVVAAANGFTEQPKVSSYAVKGNSFDELDAEGNVLAHHEYDTAEEMKVGLYAAQQARFDDNLKSDISAMKARPDNQYATLIESYSAEVGIEPAALEEVLAKPSMERTDEEQQIATQFAKVLHDTVYDNTMIHEEQSAEDGADVAESMAIDINEPDASQAAQITEGYNNAKAALNELFARNEDLAQEVQMMEQQGMPHQGIIASLDTFRPEDVQTVIDYYNQQAKFQGFMNRMSQKIDEEAANSRQRHAFKGTINGNADLSNVYTITDGTNEYYLVSGNVTTDSDGRITGSDSGLIIGMDLDGSFVNIGDTNGYSVMPSTQSLDQFEEQERIRLQELWTGAIDPTGSMMPQEQQTGEVGGEAGVANDTGANEPPTPESATEEQQPVQIPVDEKTGVKMYEQGVPVDNAIKDMEADGLDVNEESDLAINEAQEELDKLGQPKTRAERVKNDARRKELQNIIDYYDNVKKRYAELHPKYADAAPFIAQMNAATSKKKADEILNAALQAGVNPAEINPVHTQKVSDIIAKEEERRKAEEDITDRDRLLIRQYKDTPEGRAYLLDRKRVPNAEKRRKIAELIYGDKFDGDFSAWRDLRELISMWLSKGRTLDPDTFGQELGWDMGIGKDAAKVSTMFAARRENGGDGMLFNDFVHMVMEASGGRFTTEDVRNELINMFQSAQEKSDLTEYQLTTRVAEAEKLLQDEEQREADAAEDGEELIEGQPDLGMLPFAPESQNEAQPAFLGEQEDNSFLKVIKELYEKGKAYTKHLYNRAFFNVAITPEFLKQYGLTGDRFTIGYGVIARHFGKDEQHDLPQEVWEKLPEALQNPFAVTRYGDKGNGYRIYTSIKVGDGYVVVGVDVKNAGRNLEVNAISTVFARDKQMTQKEVEVYRSENITPEQAALLEKPNSSRYQPDQELSEGKDSEKSDTNQENEQKSLSREDYLTSHPLTEEQIMADTEATNDEKLAAIDYLKGEDNSGISQFYYDQIYQRSQQQKPEPEAEPNPDVMQTIQQNADEFRRDQQKAQDQKDIDDALKEFNDFLDNAKGSNIIDKFMHKGLEDNDKAEINLVTLLTGTNAAQQAFMKDLLRLGTKVGYAYIKSGIHDFQAWSKKMSETIGQKLKDVLNWEDSLIGEFLDELWNQKYTVDGERLRLSEHAEKLINNKGTDTTVNVNKQEDNVTENVVSLQGDSAEFADRQEKINALSEEIARLLRQAVLQGEIKLKTMQSVKALAKEYGLDDMSMTDLQELVEAEVVSFARDIAHSDAFNDEQKFENIKHLYEFQPSLNARDNDRIDKQQYSTPAPMAYLMGLFVDPNHTAQSGLEPSAGNGMLTIALPKEIMHVNDIDEMRLSNLQKQGFGKVTSQDGTQPFKGKFDVIVTNPPFGTAIPTIYDGIYEISALEHQMAINALESMKDDGRAAIIIGGNTEYKTNGAVQGKDRVFLNYLYSHYNVVDVINMDGKTLYSRQGTGYPVRMILINGRKQFDPNTFAPVKSKARAEQVKTYEELYKRINDDILSDSNKPAGVHDTESGESRGVDDTSNAGNTTQTGVRNVQPGGSGEQRQLLDRGGQHLQGSTESTDQGTITGGNPVVGEGNDVVLGTGQASTEPNRTTTSQTDGGRNGTSEQRDGTERLDGRMDVPVGGGSRPSVEVRRLGTEKVPYRQQSTNPYSLRSQMPAEQAEVVKKALEELGDVDQFLVQELGYSSVDDLHHGSQSPENHGGLAAEQVDSVALAIHQMNQGNAFIIGDQTGIGKGRQAAAIIRYGVKKGGNPVFITVKKGLFSDMYRDLCDIGSPELRPFIWSADDTEHSADVTDKDGNVVYKRPNDKEQKRVIDYINKYGKLPPEYDYIVTTYDSFKGGTMVYENGNKKARNFGKKKPTSGAYNSQAKRDALEALAANSYVIMDESHNAGGETSAVSGYLQYITTKAKGVTFLSATFAKRPGNMPIYSLKTAIAKAGVEVVELIDAVKRGGATFQEIMSKALTEAGQMIRRERDMSGVTIDWRGIEDEEVIQKQRKQYDEVIGLFNDIINFQRTYVDPIVDGMNDEAAEVQGEVEHTPGTRDMGINNTPFASRTYNMVQQVLLSLKAEESAKRAIEHLKAGRKPVIALANTNEGSADEVSAADGESMEMPDLSVNLKKGLRGTLRITKKDAFGNSTNSEIPFERLSPEGQKRYEEIMDAIDNASTGLSLSPIDVIKNELKKAGYKVGELTGRKAEFVYNEDGTVKRVKRQITDKKKIASDFNNGKLDALILNKSAGTGISLHASTKFKDQRQRIMIVAQAQGDVNDEVQIRGRIDRTGQVLRGMYEYVVSQIPSEQRLLMMLKAKLRSLDANTTSSQKSKFNEMQVQDIINKYGDDIVIQYLAEHVDLAEKMQNPLKWKDDWQVMSSGQLVESAERGGEAGMTASKVLGRMALLTVAEQEKMLDEISTLYQAEIDRLNEMGENDLEITEMPLKAKTLSKQVWEQGIEPGGNNPFADNSYVEKVQMDVLKKPMKGEEVKAAQERLLGGKTWEEYKQGILDRVDKWAEQKKAETTETITERAKKKAEAEQEKYVKGAKKSQEKNQMTDAEIERNGKFQYDTFYNQEMDKLKDALASIDAQKQVFIDALETFNTDDVYALPSNIYDLGSMTFEPGFGKLIDIKLSDNFSTNASTITFATLDGRRKITIPINGRVKQQNGEKRELWPVITSLTAQTRSGFFGQNMANTRKVLMQNLDNWDKLTSSAARKDGYIITGNLLKALVSTREQHVGGKLISYTTDTGEVRQGILMPDNFEPAGLTAKTPISSRKAELRYPGDKVVSADGDVTVKKNGWGPWYQLQVPKSVKKGGKYFNDETLRSLMDGQFEGSTKMSAGFKDENLDAVMKRLDELGVTVEEEHKDDTPKRMISTSNPIEAIKQAADSWANDRADDTAKTIDSLASGLKGSAKTYAIGSSEDLEALKGKIPDKAYREIEELYNEPDTGAAYLPGFDIVVAFTERMSSPREAESAWWHEQTHGFWQKLPKAVRERIGKACLEHLRQTDPATYNHIVGNYEERDWLDEACAYLIGNTIERFGTEKFLSANFEGNEEICNFANELVNFIQNGRQESNNQLRQDAEVGQGSKVDGRDSSGRERESESLRDEAEEVTDPIQAIELSAKRWRKSKETREADMDELQKDSERMVYEERIDNVVTVAQESTQDASITLYHGQNAIAHDKEIPTSQDAYQAQNRMGGVVKNQQDLFDHFFKEPLFNAVNKVLAKMEWTMNEMNQYLMTKHGLERNRELFTRDWLVAQRKRRITNPDDLNPEEKDIYEKMEKRIWEDFDDGKIDEEKRDRQLARAPQQAHQQYLEELENKYYALKAENYDKLMRGDMTLPEYFAELDKFIRNNIDFGYNPEEHDYSGLTEMYGDEDGKYSEADIMANLMADEERMGQEDREELWNQINRTNEYGLNKYLESGMRSEEEIQRIARMFHWYVPMRGFENEKAEDMYQYFTSPEKANSYVGGLLKQAKGRKSKAKAPIATMLAMDYKAISDCEQNLVNQKLYRLIQANPNDLAIVSDGWAVLDEDTGEWVEQAPLIPENATEDKIRQITLDWEDDMRRKAMGHKAKKITGKADFVYKPLDKKKLDEHMVDVMINGNKRRITIVGNPRMAQALNGHLRYEKGDGIISKSKYTSWMNDINGALMKFMRNTFTSFSPKFVMRNASRDWTHFSMLLVAREGRGYAAAAEKYFFESFTNMRDLFKKYREGTLDESKEIERDFKDFMDNGGITGFVQMKKVDEIAKEMEKIYNQLKDGKVITVNNKIYDYTLGLVESYNEAIENRARFATYRASRHYAGRTKGRSAYDAKEVTANFDKHGAGKKTRGFKSNKESVKAAADVFGRVSQILNANKLFFNATVQGQFTILKGIRDKDGSINWPMLTAITTKYASYPFVMGMAMPFINAALIGLFGGDDGDDPYANLPEWVRRKHLCIWAGWIPGADKNDFITIPVGQELAAFFSLGDIMAGNTFAPQLKPVDKTFKDELLGFLSVFSPVDMETNVTDNEKFAPVSEYVARVYSTAAPLVAIGENVSWMGRPIFRGDKYQDDKYVPEYKMAYNSTNGAFVAASKWLNDVTGGNDVERGWAQINPGTMQYIVEQYTGGPGKVFSNTVVSTGRDVKNLFLGEDTNFKEVKRLEVLGYNAFYNQADDRTPYYRAQAKYRKYKEDADELDYKIRTYSKDAAVNPDHLIRLEELAKGTDAVRLSIIKKVDKDLKNLNSAANQATGNERKLLRDLYNQNLMEIVNMLDKAGDLQ